MERNKAVDWFAAKMRKKLDANSRKSGWNKLTPRHCLERAKREIEELERAVEHHSDQKDKRDFWKDKQSAEKVIDECADVANFAMFLAHNVMEASDG